MSKFNEDLGAKVRSARDYKGLSQADLGKHIGVTFQQVQKYENGKNRVSAETLMKICDALSLGCLYFLDEGNGYPAISDSESRLLVSFRKIKSEIFKKAVLSLVKAMEVEQ